MPSGKVYALVGGTGSGKTTLVNLVARLFDPSEGEVLIDGVDVRRLRIADLRARVGIVTRNSHSNALETLRACELAGFFSPCCVLGREAAAPKPDPGGILALQGFRTRAAAKGLDRASARRIIHPNTAARQKSRLQRLIKAAKQAG